MPPQAARSGIGSEFGPHAGSPGCGYLADRQESLASADARPDHMETPMNGKFLLKSGQPNMEAPWGTVRWLSRPEETGSRQLTVVEVEIAPGEGHDFHVHPDQDELIYVVAGSVEQWIDREMRMLGPGDAVFVGMGVAHASFCPADEAQSARLVAMLSPCVGAEGYEVSDLAAAQPWRDLREQG